MNEAMQSFLALIGLLLSAGVASVFIIITLIKFWSNGNE